MSVIFLLQIVDDEWKNLKKNFKTTALKKVKELNKELEKLRPDVSQQCQIHFLQHIYEIIDVTDKSINNFMQPVDSGNVSFNLKASIWELLAVPCWYW